MFDRPSLRDEQIVAALRDRYGLATTSLEFLALGHDASAWTFRAGTEGGQAVFVKIRRRVDAARLRLARWLLDHGLEAVVAPIATIDGALSVALGDLHLVAYPFVDGTIAAERGLDDGQWIEYGRTVGKLHATHLTDDLESTLPRETFVPAWTASFERVGKAADGYRGGDPARRELVAFWRSHRAVIQRLAARAQTLGGSLRNRLDAPGPAIEFVPCHADIHTHNLLVEPAGSLRVIDWDEALLAPRERDLMFVMGSPIGLAPGKRELALFESAYGQLAVDPVILAFYHADWALQDIAGYGEQVMLDSIGVESRAYALRIFLSSFGPGGQVEVAERLLRAINRG